MSNVQQLLESANPWQSLQSDAVRLASKWDATGLLEGLGSDIEKNNMSMILENQAKQLVVETSQTGTGASFTAGTGEQWAGVALPLVRKVFGQIAAKEFVSVQPMNLPSGLVFFLDFQYGTSKNPFTSGDSLYGASSDNFGNTSTGGLYGAGRFTYSTNQFSASGATATAASASLTDINYDSAYSASAAAGEIKKLTVATSSISADIDVLGVRGFVISSGSVAAADNLNEFHYFQGGNVVFFVSASTAEIPTLNEFLIEYNKDTKDNARGDFESGASYAVPNAESTTDIVIPQINVSMRSEAIVAKTKKLKAQWTPEFAQDLNAYHSIDAEAELTSMLSEYISQEIDFEILDMLIQDAKTEGFWSAQIGREWNGNNFGNYNSTQSAAAAFTQQAWYQTLGTVIAGVSNKIHQKTLRGGANFLVVSPDVATIIESIPGYASTADNGDAQFAFGVTKVGSLNSRFQVYKNPYMKENVILMGYRGTQFLETGAVYAPYIPLIMTPLVYDPKNFTPRKGVMTRYAKKMLRGEFYGKVYVDGLHLIQ